MASLVAIGAAAFQIATNPFLGDESMRIYFGALVFANLLRIPAACLGWSWCRNDTKKTRGLLSWSFGLWFAIEVLTLAIMFFLGHYLFGKTYAVHMAEKR